ncbi:MAG TPA: AsmA-like C-terminal region-containing protein [Candidatus Dormibacteraeota bacterium]|nr:AsmA-like C-terminal region-containing protein [Candidatus Dormibacteraeota bacterium]
MAALAVASAGGLWLARSDRGQQWAAARVSAALGPSVRFVDAHFTPWPPPLAVALDGVEVLGSDGTPVVRARGVLARVRLRALVGRPPLLARVTVDGFEADVTRTADGTLRLGTKPLGGGGGALPPPLDAACPRLDLQDGRLTVRDERAGAAGTLQIEAITARVVPTRPGARISLAGRSAQLGELRAEATLDSLSGIATAPFHAELDAREADAGSIAAWLPRVGDAVTTSGRARLAATLHGRPSAFQAEIAVNLRSGEIAWRNRMRAAAPITATVQSGWGPAGLTTASGQLDVTAIKAAGLEGSAFHTAVAADAGGVTLRDAHWQALGAQWRQSGTVRLADGVTLDGAVDADAVDGAALTAALRPLLGDAVAPLRVDGPLRVHAAATGIIGTALNGQVALSMSQGTAGWDTRTATAPLAVSADAALDAGAITVRNGHAQAAAVSDGDLTADAVDARFAFADQAVQIDALTAQAFDGSWRLSGTVPLSGAPTFTLSAVGINAAHLARAALTGRHEDTGTAGDVDVDATLRGGSGRIALRLASPTLTIGSLLISRPATASGTLAWSGSAVRVDNGSARLGRVRVDGTDVGNVRAAFASAGPGHLRVSPLTARAFGGAWTVNATLARDEIDGHVRAADINLDALLATLDAGPRSKRAVATLDATVRRPRAGATTADVAVQLARGRFRFGDLTVVGPARGTATVRVDGSRWAVENGVANAAAASFNVLKATRATAHLDFDPDQIRFADLRFTAASAPWQGSGRIDLDAPSIDGALAVTRADPQTVLAMLGVNAPTLDPDGLDLSLRARTPLNATWRQTIQGSGTMALRGGFLASTGLLRAVVAAVVPSRTLREGGAPNRLTSLTQTFTLADGHLRTEDLAVDSDDYDLAASGSIGFAGELDLNGQITLTPNGIKKVFALSSLPIPGSSLWSLPTIPARIGGTLEKPDIHPEAAALAGSTARWFVDALVGAPRALGATVTRPLEQMFNGMRNLVDPRTPTPTAGP